METVNESYKNTNIPVRMIPLCLSKTTAVKENAKKMRPMLRQFERVNGLMQFIQLTDFLLYKAGTKPATMHGSG